MLRSVEFLVRAACGLARTYGFTLFSVGKSCSTDSTQSLQASVCSRLVLFRGASNKYGEFYSDWSRTSSGMSRIKYHVLGAILTVTSKVELFEIVGNSL